MMPYLIIIQFYRLILFIGHQYDTKNNDNLNKKTIVPLFIRIYRRGRDIIHQLTEILLSDAINMINFYLYLHFSKDVQLYSVIIFLIQKYSFALSVCSSP